MELRTRIAMLAVLVSVMLTSSCTARGWDCRPFVKVIPRWEDGARLSDVKIGTFFVGVNCHGKME